MSTQCYAPPACPCLRSLPDGSRKAWALAPRAWTRPRLEAEPDPSLKDVWAPHLLALNVCSDYRTISGTADTLGSRGATGISTAAPARSHRACPTRSLYPEGTSHRAHRAPASHRRMAAPPRPPPCKPAWGRLVDHHTPTLGPRALFFAAAGLARSSRPSWAPSGTSCLAGPGLTPATRAWRSVSTCHALKAQAAQANGTSEALPRGSGGRACQQQRSLSRAEVRSGPSLRAARRATQSPDSGVRYDCQVGDNVLLHQPRSPPAREDRRLHLPQFCFIRRSKPALQRRTQISALGECQWLETSPLHPRPPICRLPTHLCISTRHQRPL